MWVWSVLEVGGSFEFCFVFVEVENGGRSKRYQTEVSGGKRRG